MSTTSPEKYLRGSFNTFELLMVRRPRPALARACDSRDGRHIRRLNAAEDGHGSYVRLDGDSTVVRLATRTDPALSCWVALVQTWGSIESRLDEIETPCSSKSAAAVTGIRSFG